MTLFQALEPGLISSASFFWLAREPRLTFFRANERVPSDGALGDMRPPPTTASAPAVKVLFRSSLAGFSGSIAASAARATRVCCSVRMPPSAGMRRGESRSIDLD